MDLKRNLAACVYEAPYIYKINTKYKNTTSDDNFPSGLFSAVI